MKLAAVIALFGVIVLLGFQIASFVREYGIQSGEVKGIQGKLEQAKHEQEQLQNDFGYYSEPVNLEKELRSRFNYKLPAETLLILVSKEGSSTATSTPQ